MYQNPVYEHDFPDPFVFKFCGEYWAICTGYWHDGGVFGMLHSRDLVHWKDYGSAINPPPFEQPCYWAPEIFYDDGKFYLYYSVGNEENMEIRVAVADTPAGKYVDSGYRLTEEKFAIDAHVFVDEDNSRWLFYAIDFLEHSHIGTGTIRDRLLSPFQLEGKPQPVSRAKYDWQVYDPVRANKGNVRWHTIEGSYVIKRKGVYYQMFSGGNWQNPTYGVSFSTTRDFLAPEEWQQYSDGEKILPILQTIPGKVIGPGHNSVVRGTDNFELFCIYHRWSDDLQRGRLLALDRMDFVGERMLILGASSEPQESPNSPAFFDYFDEDSLSALGEKWVCNSNENWFVNSNAAVSNAAAENAEAVCSVESNCSLVEVSGKALGFSEKESGYGFCLKRGETNVLQCSILPLTKQIELKTETQSELFDLPTDFNPLAFHLWRVEVNNLLVKIKLDEANFLLEKELEFAPTNVALCSRIMSAAFSGFALTVGFEELFDNQAVGLTKLGWIAERGEINSWQISGGRLESASSGHGESVLLKNLPLDNFELVANVRCAINNATLSGEFGFYFKQPGAETLLTIEQAGAQYFLKFLSPNDEHRVALPDSFAPEEWNQFRLRRTGETLRLQVEKTELGSVTIPSGQIMFGLFARDARVEFEMVRATLI
jgi:GH43 family beta-xylosidase